MDKNLSKLLITGMVVLGIVLFGADLYGAHQEINEPLKRDQKNKIEALEFESKLAKEKIDVNVSALALTEEEINEMFQQAKQEIEDTVFSKEDTLDHVSHDLNIKEYYQNHLVEAAWQFSDYSIVGADGRLNQDKLKDAGTIVTAKVTLSIGESESIYSFAMNVYPLDPKSYEGFVASVQKALKAADEKDKRSENVALPKEVEGQKIVWRRPMDYRGIELALLGIIAAVAIKLGKKEELKQKEKERQKQMLADYPSIVSNLSILMGAGISFKGSLERIVNRYQSNKAKDPLQTPHPGMEEMVITYHEIMDGAGERKALENLAKRAGVKEYRKLSMLLLQSMKKGSAELIDMLEKEDINGFEMRKQMALKAGEEASTKMLLPMGGMLGVVVVILISPAFMSMNL